MKFVNIVSTYFRAVTLFIVTMSVQMEYDYMGPSCGTKVSRLCFGTLTFGKHVSLQRKATEAAKQRKEMYKQLSG